MDESAGDDVDLVWKKTERGALVQPLQGPVCGIRHLVVFGQFVFQIVSVAVVLNVFGFHLHVPSADVLLNFEFAVID